MLHGKMTAGDDAIALRRKVSDSVYPTLVCTNGRSSTRYVPEISNMRGYCCNSFSLANLEHLIRSCIGAWRKNKSVVAPVVVGPEVP
jgi:hypothetical protein